MQKEIVVGGETIPYTHRTSARARRMRLAVHRDGSVVLTTPVRTAERFGEGFVLRRAQALALPVWTALDSAAVMDAPLAVAEQRRQFRPRPASHFRHQGQL